MAERKPQINLEVDEEHKALAVALAKRKGLPLATYIRTLLYAQLEQDSKRTAA